MDARSEIATSFTPRPPLLKLDAAKTGSRGVLEKFKQLVKPDIYNTEDVEVKTKQLFDLLVDKAELQTDMHRQSDILTRNVRITDAEINTELQQGKWETQIPILDEHGRKTNQTKTATVPLDQRRDVAIERIKRRKLQELKTKSPEPKPALADRLQMIKSGDIRGALQHGHDDERIARETLEQDKTKLARVNEQVSQLLADQQVVRRYVSEFSENRINKLRTVRQVVEGQKIVSELQLQTDQLARKATLSGRQLSPGEQQTITDNQEIAQAIEHRNNDLKSDPEVFDLARLKELAQLQRDLKLHNFAETPSRRSYIDKIRQLWAHGERILLTGPTGGGKTELLKHASKSLFNDSAEVISGYELITAYEIYGKMGGAVKEGIATIVFKAGAAVKALQRNVPLIIDEINVIPNKILMRMKNDWNARVGQTITVQEDSDEALKVGDRFAWGATANVRSEHHPDREVLDDAIVRMFKSIKIRYMPAAEMYDVMLASLQDMKGGVRMSPRDASETLVGLCNAARWVQKLYNGEEVLDPKTGQKLEQRGQQSTGKSAILQKAVLDPGATLGMLKGWELSRLSGKTLSEYLNGQIVMFINNENFSPEDRYQVARIFALQGFLRGVNATTLDVSGLTQDILNAWNGYDGKRYVSKVNYTPAATVAKLDPFGKLKRPVRADVADLLGEEELQEIVVTEGDVPFSPEKTSPQTLKSRTPIAPDDEGRRKLAVFDTMHPLQYVVQNANYDFIYEIYLPDLRVMVKANQTTLSEAIIRVQTIVDNIKVIANHSLSPINPFFLVSRFEYVLNEVRGSLPQEIQLQLAELVRIIENDPTLYRAASEVVKNTIKDIKARCY